MTTTVPAGAAAPAAGPRRQPQPIEHGTPKGYRQHLARRVPTCEPCRGAIREQNREYADKRRSTDSQQTWNRGKVGTPSPPRPQPVGRACPTDACGSLATEPQPSAHMVRVELAGSREPARWYCAGGCAAYGQALAELRALEDRHA